MSTVTDYLPRSVSQRVAFMNPRGVCMVIPPFSHSQDEHPDITTDDKELAALEYPDLSKDANLPLRRVDEAKRPWYFCTVVLSRLRDCVSRTDDWKQIVLDYNIGLLVPEYEREKTLDTILMEKSLVTECPVV